MSTDWFSNDDLFRRELEKGHRWAALVAARLCAVGIPAELTPMVWRDNIEDRHRFVDEVDITVPTPGGTLQIESKSRNLRFTEDPKSYPYSTALVDTVSGWDQKNTKPFAVVFTSQRTQQMLVTPTQTPPEPWTVKKAYDSVRKINDQWYEVPKTALYPFEVLVDAIKDRLVGPR